MPQNTKNRGSRFDRAVGIFKKHGGILHPEQALRAGIHPGTLYAIRNSEALESLSRGVYRPAKSLPISNPDLLIVTARVPDGVIRLISVLAFYELTAQAPHEVYETLPRGAEETPPESSVGQDLPSEFAEDALCIRTFRK